MLAARADRLQNVFGLCCRHHEDNMIGRLLECLQERIEGRVGNLVGFVQDVDLVAIACRPVARSVAQLADLIDTAIRRRVNLDHVNGIAGPDFLATFTGAAWLIGRPLGAANRGGGS